ncbi:hypothetical protein QTG54_001411 [Skeletonema marinoi]|uniref:Uncharacterized protein n=1 Tax=Skeletonema marinoi TaxID=267567 RepID=A0AAD9DJ61_9STRA|nr:hypothetical protein QTG54_001411 [Skeletonema marinoi]
MTNPFMVTSNSGYGMSLKEACEKASFSHSHDSNSAQDDSAPSSTQDVSFLYRRKESDSYGESAPYSDSSLSKVFRQRESDSMNKRRKNSSLVKNDSSNSGRRSLSKEDVSVILSDYDHNPKEENPLYVTESNEFGRRKPSAATWTTKRHGVAQSFSKSFNNYVYRDEGLNF